MPLQNQRIGVEICQIECRSLLHEVKQKQLRYQGGKSGASQKVITHLRALSSLWGRSLLLTAILFLPPLLSYLVDFPDSGRCARYEQQLAVFPPTSFQPQVPRRQVEDQISTLATF